MKACNPGQESFIEEALANASTSLTDAQKAALTAELAKPLYTGMTTAQVLTALRGERSVVMPAGVHRRLTSWGETLEWMGKINARISLGQIPLDPVVAAVWQGKINGLERAFAKNYQYDPTTSELFQGMATQAIQSGVLTQAEVDEFVDAFLEEHPEHAQIQPPTITLLVDADGNRLFPEGLALEPADIEECRP